MENLTEHSPHVRDVGFFSFQKTKDADSTLAMELPRFCFISLGSRYIIPSPSLELSPPAPMSTKLVAVACLVPSMAAYIERLPPVLETAGANPNSFAPALLLAAVPRNRPAGSGASSSPP